MTRRTRLRSEVILAFSNRRRVAYWLVAFRADYGHMSSGQDEASLLVFCQRKCGRVKSGLRVTCLALVSVRCGGEFRAMRVLMTTLAGLEP